MTTIDPNRICYEDDRLLVYNKPAGVHSVANAQNPGTSLAEALIEYDARYAQASPEARDAGLIQRLDYWTSGCLLIAKDKACWGKLINARKQLSIKKLYRALVEGHMQDATLS
ncbi:MAG: hypothetical protein KDD62_08285, partial [Bdellovibrionales bacterium]|nr:hypothetical protein [Bdellovibrionales bacterium]